MDIVDHPEKANNRKVFSGYRGLDEMLGGFKPAELIILAARPSMGKTTLALDIARMSATTHDKSVVIFSLKMSSQQLVDRMLAAHPELSPVFGDLAAADGPVNGCATAGQAAYDPVADLYACTFADVRVRRAEWRWLESKLPAGGEAAVPISTARARAGASRATEPSSSRACCSTPVRCPPLFLHPDRGSASGIAFWTNLPGVKVGRDRMARQLVSKPPIAVVEQRPRSGSESQRENVPLRPGRPRPVRPNFHLGQVGLVSVPPGSRRAIRPAGLRPVAPRDPAPPLRPATYRNAGRTSAPKYPRMSVVASPGTSATTM